MASLGMARTAVIGLAVVACVLVGSLLVASRGQQLLPNSACPDVEGFRAPNPLSARIPGAPPRTPEGYVPVTVAGVAVTGHGSALVLMEQAAERVVPILIGSGEAASIELRLAGREFHRPLTHDLLDTVMDRLGGSIREVRIDVLGGGVFKATLVLEDGAATHEIDARSSDGVAIALGQGAPIFLARPVLDAAGVRLDDLQVPSPGSPLLGEPEEAAVRL